MLKEAGRNWKTFPLHLAEISPFSYSKYMWQISAQNYQKISLFTLIVEV
jgi:hypothetical protein